MDMDNIITTFHDIGKLKFKHEGEIIQLPEHGVCFICGTQNSNNVGLVWYAQQGAAPPSVKQNESDLPNLLVYSEFNFTLAQQGPPAHAHGGASASVIDEAMGVAVWLSGLQVLLAKMKLKYHRPTPLNVPLRVEAWVYKAKNRKAHAKGHLLLPNNKVAVEGKGLYVHAPKLFDVKTNA